jgi:hypothetical protein
MSPRCRWYPACSVLVLLRHRSSVDPHGGSKSTGAHGARRRGRRGAPRKLGGGPFLDRHAGARGLRCYLNRHRRRPNRRGRVLLELQLQIASTSARACAACLSEARWRAVVIGPRPLEEGPLRGRRHPSALGGLVNGVEDEAGPLRGRRSRRFLAGPTSLPIIPQEARKVVEGGGGDSGW